MYLKKSKCITSTKKLNISLSIKQTRAKRTYEKNRV